MPTLSFEGKSHQDLVRQVEEWLETAKEEEDLGPVDLVNQGAKLTKDVLGVIAAAAPDPVAENEVVKALTEAGYRATDLTSGAIIDTLEQFQDMTGETVVKEVRNEAASAMYKMNKGIAKQIIKGFAAAATEAQAANETAKADRAKAEKKKAQES